MPYPYSIPPWKSAPFIRLLLPFIAGILVQWYQQYPLPVLLLNIALAILIIFLFYLLPLRFRYKLQLVQGLAFQWLLGGIAAFACWQKDIRHQPGWYGHYCRDTTTLLVRIDEPVTEKPRTYKATGWVEAISTQGKMIPCKGKILLYFLKNEAARQLKYGDLVLIHKKPQPITNAGNPGGFNYSRYAGFRQIYFNSFLGEKDWAPIAETNVNPFRDFIFSCREMILACLKQNITGKAELGVAEALLIGYKEDLDKDLVQAYSNTGVVHIIAISGLHLGLIYAMLVWFCKRIPVIKNSRLTKMILVLSALWIFALLTGASASVLRSAVMFSCIIMGEQISRRPSIYNSLAASAFLLLCYDPYFLWDVGFQLSYLALIGIVAFQKPIEHWFYCKNKWLGKLWGLAAISLSAQLLTFPVCIYYFHQFPNFFLISNLIAVPLSSLILFTEILLVAFAWIPYAGSYIGKAVSWMTDWMNKMIIAINGAPGAVWDNIQASLFSTVLLYCWLICFLGWLVHGNKILLRFALLSFLMFVINQAYGRWETKLQQQLVVYNIPRQRAIDIVQGQHYQFIGDSSLYPGNDLYDFHIKPARTAFRLDKQPGQVRAFSRNGDFIQHAGKRILLLDKTPQYEIPDRKIDLDIIIISKNPNLSIPYLASIFNCKQYVFDASNSLWKIGKWQAACSALHLQCHSVPGEGAFVLEFR